MSEDKHAAFVRLADKRIETVEEAIRIFSNLSGPSYEWSNAEVQSYLDRITAGAETCLGRFTETKRWQSQIEGLDDVDAADEEEPAAQAHPAEIEPAAGPPAAGLTPREHAMLAIALDTNGDVGALTEMLAMQREVIASLQASIDGLRGHPSTFPSPAERRSAS